MADDTITRNTTRSQRLGDYDLIRRVGAGAYADVWLGRDAVGKCVAVKVIDRQRLALISRRNREEEALGLLRTQLPEHAHLIRVHHVATDDARFYYVMDLADDASQPASAESAPTAIDLATYSPRTLDGELHAAGRLSIEDAIGIIRDLLSAVACLHDHGIIHRDIKPSNIVCVDGQWKLADIGLLTADTTSITAVGTLEFMPPSGHIDRTADLYALGKLLFCLVTGNSPRAFPQIPRVILTDENRAAMAEVNDIVVRACAADPAARFGSADALDRVLDECLGRVKTANTRRRELRHHRVFVLSIALAMAVPAVVQMCGFFLPARRHASASEVEWISLFNGHDLSGWYKDKPFHGQWSVVDGMITVAPTDEYKTLLTEDVYAPGTLRATVVPGDDGARIGLGYLMNPTGPLFMIMADKYTWIRGYRKDFPPDEPGNWRSFPGPIPRAGERVELEIEYGPDRVLLSVGGTVLQELPGVAGEGHVALHVWKGDWGEFKDIRFTPAE